MCDNFKTKKFFQKMNICFINHIVILYTIIKGDEK